MKQLAAIVVLVVAANAVAVARYWWNRTEVRSEFELSEEHCTLSDITRNRSMATLHCRILSGEPTRNPKGRDLEREGYAAITVDLGSGRISEFAKEPGALAGEGRIVVPATQGNGVTAMALPSMPVRNPRAGAGPFQGKFRAKIRIGRNYEPWLVELR